MFSHFVDSALPLAFAMFVTCALTTLVSGLVLLVFKLRKTNELLQHPYLKQQPFERYPISIQALILMDYFFRLSFPGVKFWVIGHANQLLPHVEPKDIPTTIKWPIVGLWAGCFGGLLAMLAVWLLLFLQGGL